MRSYWTRTRWKRINCWKYSILTFLFLFLLLYVTVQLYRKAATVPAPNRVYIFDGSGDSLNMNGDADEDGRDFDRSKMNWKTTGWNYYTNPKDFAKYKPLPTGLGNFSGLWVPKTVGNSIQLQSFQREIPLPVAIGIRLYVIGEVGLEIRFSDSSRLDPRTIRLVLDKNSTRLEGFCNQIIVDNLPSLNQINGFVDLIEIKGILPIDDDTSFLAIDKVIVTLGPKGTQQSLLYTLLPDEWCETKGVLFYS